MAAALSSAFQLKLKMSASSLKSSSSQSFGFGLPAAPVRLAATKSQFAVVASAEEPTERLRLNNVNPAPGSRRGPIRKGRGPGSGKGKTCGFGHKGQKSRAGSGTRPGFEGGQTPLYRRLPKLKGIAGGMGAGLPKYVTVNLSDLVLYGPGEEVSIESLAERGIINPSGRDRLLPLKVLGDGEVGAPLTVKATAFSAVARASLEAAGCTIVDVPKKIKWTRKAHEAAVAASS